MKSQKVSSVSLVTVLQHKETKALFRHFNEDRSKNPVVTSDLSEAWVESAKVWTSADGSQHVESHHYGMKNENATLQDFEVVLLTLTVLLVLEKVK